MITLGNILFFIIGLVVGASIIYGFDVFWDCKEDRADAQREAVIREAFERLKEKEEAKAMPARYIGKLDVKTGKLTIWENKEATHENNH